MTIAQNVAKAKSQFSDGLLSFDGRITAHFFCLSLIVFLFPLSADNPLYAVFENDSVSEFSEAIQLIDSKNFALAAKILESISTRPEILESNLRRAYLLGHCYRNLGLWDEAAKNYQKAENNYLLSDYAAFHAAEAYQKLSNWQNAIFWYKRLTEKYPPQTPNFHLARYQMAECYLQLGDHLSALAIYDTLIQNPSSGYARKSEYQSAIVYEGLKDFKNAFLRYQKLIDEGQSDSTAKEALSRIKAAILSQSPPPIEITRTQRFSYGLVLFNSAKYPDARAEFEKAADNNSDLLAQKSAYFIGGSYYNQRDYRSAIEIYQKLAARFPLGEYLTRAKYRFALSYRRLGDYDKATKLFEDFVSAYSWSDLADDALFDIASMSRIDKKYNEAINAYARLIKLYSKSEFADESLWWLNWCKMKAGQPEAAIHGFRELTSRFPSSPFAGSARFWTGKLQERLKRWEQAKETYEALINDNVFYYSLRAKDRLRALSDEKRVQTQLNLNQRVRAKVYNLDFPWSRLGELPFLRASELIKIGVYDDAIVELSGLSRSEASLRKNIYYYLIICNQKLETFYQAWIYANRMAQLSEIKSNDGSLPLEIYKLLYPLYYKEAIDEACAEFQMDLHFVMAMIREESRHDAQVISSAGAYGLMQIIPATGSEVAKKLRVDNFNSQMLFQPKVNVRFGTWYMKHLSGRFKDIGYSEYIVSGAYNSGPDPVDRWIEKYGISDIDEFIEDVPYKETRHHIKKVMDSYGVYKEVYGE